MVSGADDRHLAEDLPPVQPVTGQPTQKRTLFDKLVKVTAKILRQSR